MIQVSPLARDPHALYEVAVQAVDHDLDFCERVWRTVRGGRFHLLREDFCGTALLACAWALRRRENRAVGLDLHGPVLAWARRQHLARMGEAARRVTLLRRDVRAVTRPAADVAVALNFSHWAFRERDALRRYFRAVRRSLTRRGLFVVNAFGGSEAFQELVEKRRVAPSQGPDGLRIPGFTYVWEHARFSPLDHRLLAHIHFHFADGTKLRRAFTYDWRAWTLPEIQEVMREAGFSDAQVYVEGWDEKRDRPDEIYRRRRHFRNQEGWLAFVVGVV